MKNDSGTSFKPSHILTIDGRESIVMLWEDGFYTRQDWNRCADNDYSLEDGLLCLHGQPVSGTWRRITSQPMEITTGYKRINGTDWPVTNKVEKRGRQWLAIIGLCNGVPLDGKLFNARREALEYAGL